MSGLKPPPPAAPDGQEEPGEAGNLKEKKGVGPLSSSVSTVTTAAALKAAVVDDASHEVASDTTSGAAAPVVATAASAADSAASRLGEATLAEVLQAVETLTNLFGFDWELAQRAVEAVGTDVSAASNWILDGGHALDKGGAVYPIDNCPHIETHVLITPDQLQLVDPVRSPCDHFLYRSDKDRSQPAGAKEDVNEDGKCPAGENWLCLQCGVVRCSRYVNGHGVSHWKDTCTKPDNLDDPDNIDDYAGHCVAVSFADLSVWCHACSSYVRHASLDPIVKALEQKKFGGSDMSVTASRDSPEVSNEPHPKRVKSSGNLKSDIDASQKDPLKPDGNGPNVEIKGGEIDKDEEEESGKGNSDQEERGLVDVQSSGPASNARGFPFSLLEGEDEDMDAGASIDYVFGDSLPSSLEEAAKFILSDKCSSILILAGAGMSVPAGIPDFRSRDGLYATMDADALTAGSAEKEVIKLDPSAALDQHLFMQNPLPCLELNRSFLLGTRNRRWKAPLAHRFVELLHDKTGKLVRLYTQNIDGLEDQCSKLPREKVVNVHGSMDRAECATCLAEVDYESFCTQVQEQIKDLSGEDDTAPSESTPIDCPVCGCATVKPAITLFRASLPKRFFEMLPHDLEDVDLLIVMGTSLRVTPANTIVFRIPETAMRMVIDRKKVGRHLGLEYGCEATRDFFARGDIDATVLELMSHLGWIDDLAPLLEENALPESSAELLRNRLESHSDQATAN